MRKTREVTVQQRREENKRIFWNKCRKEKKKKISSWSRAVISGNRHRSNSFERTFFTSCSQFFFFLFPDNSTRKKLCIKYEFANLLFPLIARDNVQFLSLLLPLFFSLILANVTHWTRSKSLLCMTTILSQLCPNILSFSFVLCFCIFFSLSLSRLFLRFFLFCFSLLFSAVTNKKNEKPRKREKNSQKTKYTTAKFSIAMAVTGKN